MEKFDVVIIGGGPAGLKAAEILAKGGESVIVLEKNPVIGQKVCAGGLIFDDFKLGIPLSLVEKIFYTIKIHCFGKEIEVKRLDKFLLTTISRKKLGQWMAEKALKEGAKIWLNSRVIKIEQNCVILENGKVLKFNYLIGADGSTSLVRRFLNLPMKIFAITLQYILPQKFDNLEFFFDKDLFDQGYAWIFPHKNYTFVGVGVDSRFRKAKEIKGNFQYWLKERKIDTNQGKLESFIINCDYQGFEFGDKFLVGDAAGLTSTLTGKGIYPAILSGQEVAKKILDRRYGCPVIKSLLRNKLVFEKLGKLLMFKVLKSKILTQAIIKRFC